jgi:hypothetical protein
MRWKLLVRFVAAVFITDTALQGLTQLGKSKKQYYQQNTTIYVVMMPSGIKETMNGK